MRSAVLVIGLVLAVPLGGFAQQYQFNETNHRQWRDSSGQSTLAGRLVSFDKKGGIAVLDQDDGTRVKIPQSDLWIADRSYIRRQTNRLDRQAKRAAKVNQERTKGIVTSPGDSQNPADFQLNSEDSGGVGNDANDIRRLYNISWHTSPESASVDAQRDEGLKDDRPIVWFRVLGDLAGYM